MEVLKKIFNVRVILWSGIILALVWWFMPGLLPGSTLMWRLSFSTNFDKKSIDLGEIMSGGPRKDGIPSIDHPTFKPATEISSEDLGDTVPVIGFQINGDARAYPLGILMSHEIVNDTVGGKPVAVTFCPLCNASIVFDATVDGQHLTFGTTGKLRNSDLVMYDRETESWWQQFLGEAIVGDYTGTRLKVIPSRVESFARFKERFPDGKVLEPASRFRGYGSNPYVGYDTDSRPFLFRGPLPENMHPMARLVVVDDEAWTLDLLRKKRKITNGDIVITWEPGQNSALDSRNISEGRDVGNVVVQRETASGLEDVAHDVTFAFVLHAFKPEAKIHEDWPSS